MKKTLAALTLSSIGLASVPAVAADYVIDTEGAHAAINFKIQHLGYSWLTGRFNDFEGSFSYDADKVEDSKITVTVDTSSIDSNHAERDKHLRSDDFLSTDKHGEAKFVSKRIENVEDNGEEFDVVGDLTLHGVTKEITIEVEKVGEGEDPWGGYRVGFEGDVELTLKDFGIDYDLGPASRVVHMELHIEGIRQ
ncbi:MULTISPECIES: YceI family protein [unclassified Marinimicrobium]|jgi:polyisoprenoid-binding protein YceI|uniref:YceI family protein n=1 Tax=Marinimicrobium TaxID=359337 RepID=UPI00257EB883|nr:MULTISPECIES: YceI family protein [unclassified Marinimicrobium]|tara:strand:+ start:357 stop:938 length:582 start_codon:yes stop_codon:yes gene_type:complete